MKKRLLAVLVCGIMLFSMLPVRAVAAPAAHADHCLCGDGQDSRCTHSDTLAFRAWEKTNELPDTGNWYLTRPVEVSAQTLMQSGDALNLCLNGQTITAKTSGFSIYRVEGGADLTITDCTAVTTGTDYTAGALTAAAGVTGSWGGSAVYVTGSGSTFKLYEGKLTGFTATANSNNFGGAVHVASAEFTMYGGEISHNTVTTTGSYTSYGGGVVSNGTFKMYGGNIHHNTAKGGGGVCMTGGTFEMHGGAIHSNTATEYGGGVRVNAAGFTLCGGTIRDNVSTKDGGGIFTASGVGVTVRSGTVSGNSSTTGTAGGLISQGALVMEGGTVTGNHSGNAAGIGGVFGGNTMTLSGDVQIYGNTRGGTTPVNLRVGSKNIDIGAAGMGPNAKVHITYTYGAADKVVGNANNTDYSAAFHSDDPAYYVGYNATSKKLQLVARPALSAITVPDTTIILGTPKQITAVATPATANLGTITWTSADTTVATVVMDTNDPLRATVTGLKTGTTEITVASSTGKSATFTVTVLNRHEHCLCADGQDKNCGHDAATWQPWTYTNKLPGTNEPGNWYLTKPVELTATAALSGGAAVNLCLNGQSITMKQAGQRIYHLSGGAKLNITDCTAALDQDTYTAGVLTYADGITGPANAAAIWLTGANTTLNLYDGRITGITAAGASIFGGAIQINSGSTLNMYGGSIDHITAGTDTTGLAYGGAVQVAGTFRMYGGQICDNTALATGNAWGGGVFVDTAGTFSMQGGSIRGNSAKLGAGVYTRATNPIRMSDGRIEENTATGGAGGGIRVDAGGFELSGGYIQNNSASTYGGGVYTATGINLLMNGGQILDNTAVNGGGGVLVSGAFGMTNGLISGNKATTEGPGGVFAGGDIVLSGNVKITGNTGKDDLPFNLRVGSKAVRIGTEGMGTDAKIGVTYTYTADPKLIAQANETDFSSCFVSDDAGFTVAYNADKLLVLEKVIVETHEHCLCADDHPNCKHESISWQAWNKTDSLPDKNNPGNWYLTADVQLNAAEALVTGSQVNLCLNGHKVTVMKSGINLYHVSGGAKLAITDCKGTGVMQPDTGVTGVVGGSALYITGETTLTELYGGKLTGFVSTGENAFGGAVQVANNASFNLYNGEITGNTANGAKLAYGGGVIVKGTFNMYGGKISGNRTIASGNAYGGGVLLDAGVFNMYGGEVSGNTAKNSAGVYVKSGVFNLYDGGILNNTATEGGGGGVRVDGGSMVMLGGKICGNTTPTTGGGIHTAAKIGFTMHGGEISGNTARTNGGGVTVQGPLVMTGGQIINNRTEDAAGAGVFAGDTITLSGAAKVSGNICGEKTTFNLRVAGNPVLFGKDGLMKDALIGITYVGKDTSLVFSQASEKNFSANFASDNASYKVRYDPASLKLMLYIPMTETVAHTNTEGYHTSDTQWVSWDVAGALPTQSGHYYLAGDVKLEKTAVVDTDAKIVLCLNGRNVDATTAKRAYRLSGGAQLAICDCTAHTEKDGSYAAGKIFGATNTAIFVGSEKPAVTVELYDGKITGNTIETAGAAVILQGGGVFNMHGGEISGNTAKTNGGAVFNGEGTFNLLGGRIANNTAGSAGGGVYVTSKGVMNMSGGQVSGNSSSGWGGGLYLAGKSVISGGSVSGNYAAKEGGGVYITDCVVTMTGGSISYNRSAFNGGGVCARGEKGKLELKGGQIGYNKAVNDANGAGNGGGIIVQGKGTLIMSGGSVAYNECKLGGGGIRTAGGSTFRIYGGTVSGNKAYQGAGIYMDDDALIEGGTISKNVAQFEGAGLYINNCDVTMNGGTVTENELLEGNGAGITVRNKAVLTLNDGTVSGNKASYHGGGILVQSEGKLLMNGGTVSGNQAGQTGGGIRSSGCVIEITGGTIRENQVGISGAGIFGEVKLKLSDCKIEKNKITGNDGKGSAIMLLDGTDLQMANVEITDNETVGGTGAVHLPKAATAQIEACKFTGNKASTGAAVYVDANGNAVINGSTFTGNVASVRGSAICAEGIITLTDSSVTGNTDGAGNAAVCLSGSGMVSTMGGNVRLCDNTGGELLLENGAKVQIPDSGLGENAKILLYLPEGGVTQCVTGPYHYACSGDVYTLTKGETSLTTPDVDAAPEATKPSGDQVQIPEDKGDARDGNGWIIPIVIVVVLAVAGCVIIFAAKRKKSKEK